jgi:hypothetical protein
VGPPSDRRTHAGHLSEGVGRDQPPDDQVIETGAAADVIVTPAAVEQLDDRVLDAEVGPDGAITFALHTQGSMNGRQARLPTDIRHG